MFGDPECGIGCSEDKSRNRFSISRFDLAGKSIPAQISPTKRFTTRLRWLVYFGRLTVRRKLWNTVGSLLAVVLISGLGSTSAQTKAQPAAGAAARPAASSIDIPIPDIPYTKFVLNNGLTVLVHEDHKTPVVAVNTWYHVGSKNEKPGKTGFAHLFEHLMFSGSENFNYTYINAMEKIGATNLNGTTNNDRTNYFENVPTSMLDYVLFAESDRMGHLLGVLDQKKLDLQRG